MFKINDLVTRKSYNNDILFRITNIENEVYTLKGENTRLIADAIEEDLEEFHDEEIKENDFVDRIDIRELNREDYFYLPGKILHIDGDQDYLNKCLDFYDKNNVRAKGINSSEEKIHANIKEWIKQYCPNIIIITGHDAYYEKKGKKNELKAYKNTEYFIKAIKEARETNMNQDELIIIAGACQSNYEELILAGANFASSPKRINIHALDPAIIATLMAYSEVNKEIDLMKILEYTKYGAEGIGGIITKGTMHIGYPR